MAILILPIILILIIIWVIVLYNKLIKYKIKVDNAWSDVRVFLKKDLTLYPIW